MKIAICISGICRGNFNRNILLMKHHFPKATFFFSTWEGKDPAPFDNAVQHPEPTMTYHPYVDVEWDKAPKFLVYKSKGKDGEGVAKYERTIHHNKQLLAHAYLLEEVPQDYDMIIRTRYDATWHPHVDFQPWVEKSYNENIAVGFGTRGERHPDLAKLAEVPKKYYDKDTPHSVSRDWAWYIMDPIVMHPRSLFDIERVYSLHNNKGLLPAEFGWYQILSEPHGDTHSCVYGGVQIEWLLKKHPQNLREIVNFTEQIK